MIAWIRQWLERRRTRHALLATPGVDLLVRRVMDERYGVHNWRVRDGMLEAHVLLPGSKEPWWGLIGPLHARTTRIWLREGASGVSHAKDDDIDAPTARVVTSTTPYPPDWPDGPDREPVIFSNYEAEANEQRYYAQNYADTEPSEEGPDK